METCDDLVAKENDELKQEVERLLTDLRRLKGKYTQEQVQPGDPYTLHATVVYEESQFANSFVWLGPAEQGIDANGAGVAGLATATPV